MTSAPPSRVSPLAVFRHRTFTRLWLAQFVSQFGSGLTTVAAGLMVYRQTGSALSVGLMLAVTVLPSLALGLLAGAVVDRVDRRRLMIAADVARAALIALIPLLSPHGLGWLYALVLCAGVASQFFEPAFESALPETAPEAELDAANTFMTVSSTGAWALGFGVAGLIASASLPFAFVLDALTFAASAALLWRVRLAPPERADGAFSVRAAAQDVRAGLTLVRGQPALRSLFATTAPVLLLFGLINALLLPFTMRALHADSAAYGLLESVSVVGNVAGSLLLVAVVRRLQPGQWMAISLLGLGAFQGLLGLLHHVPGALLCLLISGLFNAPLVYARRTIVQREVARELRGRVGSALFVLRDVALVGGALLAGLADVMDVRVLMLACGALLVLMALVTARLPGLRGARGDWRRALAGFRLGRASPEAAVPDTH